MSLQDDLNAEAEFIGSVVKEMEAEKVNSAARAASDRLYAANIEYGKVSHLFESERKYAAIDECYAANEAWEKASEAQRQYFYGDKIDRRDDITKPATTYSFPPATLSW